MREVSQFIVVAPANKSKAVQWAEHRLIAYLGDAFPHYQFQVEAFGPFSDDDEFTVIPIVSRPPEAGETTLEPDAFFLCKPLDPRVIPQIQEALRAFDISGVMAN
jgi:hypothetical protein